MQHLTVKFKHAQMQQLLKQGAEFIPDSHYARSLKATEEMSIVSNKVFTSQLWILCISRLERLATILSHSNQLNSIMST